MNHKVFIPVPDEWLFDHPELISAPLRPYSQGMACYHWLDVRINPQDDKKIAETLSQPELNKVDPVSELARFAA